MHRLPLLPTTLPIAISLLFEEVGRLRTAIANIQESHNLQIQRLEDRLEEKRQHIVRLESRIEKQQDFDDIKKENSMLRSVDLSASHESKQFQELLLERTKALAAQTEAIKSSSANSEGSPPSGGSKGGVGSGDSTAGSGTAPSSQPTQPLSPPAASNNSCSSTGSSNSSTNNSNASSSNNNNNHNNHNNSTSSSTPSSELASSSESRSMASHESSTNTITPPTNSTTLMAQANEINNNCSTARPASSPSMAGCPPPPPPPPPHLSQALLHSPAPARSPQPHPLRPPSSSAAAPQPLCPPPTTPTPTPTPTDPLAGLSSFLGPPLQNVEQFGSFLGEELVSSWRRGGLDLPPPPGLAAAAAAVAAAARNPALLMNHHRVVVNSPPTDLAPLAHHNSASTPLDHDKPASHHEHSSSASTPVPREDSSRHDERHLNGGGGLTPMSVSKSPLEDNNNSLAALSRLDGSGGPGTGGLIQGLPFQFQERGHFRFADASDMQMPPGSMVGRLGDSLIPKGDPMEAKLQEMLRYNMDKYANQNLDTLHISRRVRELLSVHNIGQRLFAKYVLGLSQGTVSELLSKPKPWDKLTEKGRDSYRKMHAWACDENAIMLLKSLIPKKGAEPGMPSYGRPDGDLNDDRIQHILSEASMMKRGDQPTAQQQAHHQQQMREQMQLQQQQLQQLHLSGLDDSTQHSDNDSKSPHNRDVHSPFSKDYLSGRSGSAGGRPKKYENDDLPQDKITKIYQEEFSKLMRSPRDFPNLLFPHFLGGGMPPMDRLQDENIRMALEAYHRELAKLQQNATAGLPGMPGGISNLPNFLALQQHQQQQQQQQQQQSQQPSQSSSQQPSNVATQQASQQPSSQHPATTGLNGGSAQDLSLPKEKQMAMAKLNGSMSDAESDADMSQKELDESMKHSAFSLVKPKPSEPSGLCTPTTTASSAAPSPISNSILPPTITPTDDFSVAASPLQRMASITNSLITQPPVTPHHTTQQRPLKAILPPITQQQFDLYNNLNTEDIVRRVKESLSQYSISQRLFGESVLGLSQGSVSDLLARPKPWHMLTQKGREPFIRMKMFLEDENAVHKLVASQYKIAPEKLMRTGNYSGTPQIPGMHLQKSGMPPSMPKMLSDSLTKLQQDQQKTLLQLQISQMQQQLPSAQAAAAQHQHQLAAAAAAAAAHHAAQVQEVQRHNAQQQQPPSSQASPLGPQNASSQQRPQQPSPQTMLLTPPGIPPQHAIALQGHPAGPQEKKSSIMMPIHSPVHQQGPPGSVGQHPSQPGAPNSMRGSLHQHISPTVYEMAALTQDLDTQVITTKIKEALLANNIGQKIFGEAVLGLSQGSVSELLSKPKPWHMLSIKGREPFIRMQLWLSDANNVERLQALKNERREASKRRRSTGPGGQDNSSDTSSNDTSEFYHSNSPGPGSVGSATAPPNKKQRVLFSEEQKEALRLAFALDPYPNVQTIEFLASELGLSTRTITNWFHNHRMRLKQQVPHGQPSEPIPSRENQTGAPFDPVQFRVLLGQRLMEIQKERLGLSGMPLPYPPYFAAGAPTANLAALIGRGFMPGSEADLAALNKAVSEQMSGLDLSMQSSLKREGDDDYEEEAENEEEAGSGHMSDSESMDGGGSSKRGGDDDDLTKTSSLSSLASLQAMSRISRRKPAAPQWVNPDWQDPDKKTTTTPSTTTASTTVGSKKDADSIINGVCVLQPPDGVPSVQQRFAAAMAAAAAAAVAAAAGAGATVPSHDQDADPTSDADNDDDDDDDAKSNHSKHSAYNRSDAGPDNDRPRASSLEQSESDVPPRADSTHTQGGAEALSLETNGNRSATASPGSNSVTVKREILEDTNGDRWDSY
ncbi:AGAP001187-PA-like protein [Anopheles sinensis]|uniref:Homeobox protein cut-like n=1 Tax=Anopheles sinensis TaxID=74873 RepID=A0A084W0D9_ANOSI|nr:AGAP001187-PA-like protein [Anopheles sinensis]